MREKLNKVTQSIVLAVGATLIAVAACTAQSAKLPTTSTLTDAQAQVLIQSLLASQGTPGVNALSQAQSQALMQYLITLSLAQSMAAASPNTSAAGAIPGGAAAALSQAQVFALMQKLNGQGPLPAGAGALPGLTQLPAASGFTATTQAPGSNPLAPKKPGVIRLGVITPDAQMGQGNSGSANVAEPIRTLIIQYLSGPAVEVTPITALVPAQIGAEAKQKECDYLLYSSISQKKTGGMGFLSKAMPMANMIPMVGMARGAASVMTAAVATQVAQTAASTAASSVKAKNEVAFEYKLAVPGNPAPVLANTAKAKAKTDGDDVITPLIQQAATAILAEVTKKR